MILLHKLNYIDNEIRFIFFYFNKNSFLKFKFIYINGREFKFSGTSFKKDFYSKGNLKKHKFFYDIDRIRLHFLSKFLKTQKLNTIFRFFDRLYIYIYIRHESLHIVKVLG